MKYFIAILFVLFTMDVFHNASEFSDIRMKSDFLEANLKDSNEEINDVLTKQKQVDRQIASIIATPSPTQQAQTQEPPDPSMELRHCKSDLKEAEQAYNKCISRDQ